MSIQLRFIIASTAVPIYLAILFSDGKAVVAVHPVQTSYIRGRMNIST